MALINPTDLTLRSLQLAKVSSLAIDTNMITLQQTSLASSNSLIYKSASYSVNSNTSLPNPSQGYFNSRTIPSGIYYPFQDGSSFVFKFSNTDYGYYASASSTNKWWSVLSSVETAYEKRLCISEIGVSYNYWEFKMDSLTFTNSTWIFAGQKVLGPTYSDFEPEKQFTIAYSLSGGMSASGASNSIAGQIVDGYTTLNYPLLSKTVYVGNLDSQKAIGWTSGNDMMGAGVETEFLYLGHISFVDMLPGDGPVTQACCGKRKPRRVPRVGAGSLLYDRLRPSGVNSSEQIVFDVPTEYFEVVSHATSSQGLSNFIGIHVGALTIGLTESKSVEMVILDQGNPVGSWNKPSAVLGFGSYLTSSNDNFYDSVGIDTYAMSTSYLELTPITYSIDASNILLNGTWGTESGGTYSVLNIDSDGVSVNKLYFGNVNSGQSLVVSGGDLYVNDVVFIASGGVTGPQGLAGATGPQGLAGATGPQGFDGATGPQGLAGATGPQGLVGATGPQGFDGATGPQGLAGATGPAGLQLTFQGAWETLPTIYGVDDYVSYGGSTWFTSAGSGDGVPPSPTNSNWTLFGGAALIVGTAIPNNSSSPGSKGEIRVDNGQYLYIHTGAQWLKSSMTFSTF
jgi:hypothetical protein